MDALMNSNMSYPTWEEISKKLAVKYVDPKAFGDQPLRKDNDPLYSIINDNEVKSPCGIDIPILLEPKDRPDGPLIIILGESALRGEDELNKITAPNNVILGTPYALHLENGPSQCGVYWRIFNALLEEGYSLYITDIIKVWWKDKKLVPKKYLDIAILKYELKNYEGREPVIVAWGKKAQNALKKIDKIPNKDFLPLPHPSAQNRDSWKLKILEKAVFVKKDPSYATDYYENQEAPTTDDTVAKIALDEILSFAGRNLKK